MARRKPVDPLCPSVQIVMRLLGRRWSGLILAALQDGALRFRELGDRLPDIGDKILSARLKELERDGLVSRTVGAGPPVRVSYALTTLGEGFSEVVAAIETWGNAFAAAQGGRRLPARGRRSADPGLLTS